MVPASWPDMGARTGFAMLKKVTTPRKYDRRGGVGGWTAGGYASAGANGLRKAYRSSGVSSMGA